MLLYKIHKVIVLNTLLRRLITFIGVFFLFNFVYSQTPLPIDFESGFATSDFIENFGGATGTLENNPNPSGINTSSKVGQIVKCGDTWGGSRIIQTTNFDFSTNGYICMQMYTDAPVGSEMRLAVQNVYPDKSAEISAYTTKQNEWETICWDMSSIAANWQSLVFHFDYTRVGTCNTNTTFFFDSIVQVSAPIVDPLFFKTDSEYFCDSPGETVTLTFTQGSGGPYNWYADASGGPVLAGGNNTASYTTPVLTGEEDYWVEDLSSVTTSTYNVGPNMGGTDQPEDEVIIDFTSNVNGTFNGVTMYVSISGSPASCSYTITANNLTQGTSVSSSFSGAIGDYQTIVYTFSSPLTMSPGDNIQLTHTSTSLPDCATSAHTSGAIGTYYPALAPYTVPYTYPLTTTDGELTFTGHNVPNALSGINYNISVDVPDAARVQVTALVDCSTTKYEDDEIFNLNDSFEKSIKFLKGSADGEWQIKFEAEKITDDNYIDLKIYSTAGKLVYQKNIIGDDIKNKHKISLNTSGRQLYFAVVNGNLFRGVKKLY